MLVPLGMHSSGNNASRPRTLRFRRSTFPKASRFTLRKPHFPSTVPFMYSFRMHTSLQAHGSWGTALARSEHGHLSMISQGVVRFFNRKAHVDSCNCDMTDTVPRERLADTTRGQYFVFPSKHELLVGGVDIGETFLDLNYSERTREVQLKAAPSDLPTRLIATRIVRNTAAQFTKGRGPRVHYHVLNRRMAERADRAGLSTRLRATQ
jgi:hypothetical protein